jgi:hypothetical protein
MTAPRRPGLDQFWEKADRSDSGQHPLERELDERVDALARYRRLIAEAQQNGRDQAAEILMRQHDREAASVDRLREALQGTDTD